MTEDAVIRDAILRKAKESTDTKERFFRENAERIVACAHALSSAFDAGGRLFTMGNGGSACDAEHAAVEFMHPVLLKRAPLPAIALTAGPALLSAVANDREFGLAYAEPLRVLARRGDVALAISTSGKSPSVVRGLQAAREIGMLTVGFTGKDAGKMPALCDHCFVVQGFSIHRIQETHETLLHVLWDAVHLVRGEEDVL